MSFTELKLKMINHNALPIFFHKKGLGFGQLQKEILGCAVKVAEIYHIVCVMLPSNIHKYRIIQTIKWDIRGTNKISIGSFRACVRLIIKYLHLRKVFLRQQSGRGKTSQKVLVV